LSYIFLADSFSKSIFQSFFSIFEQYVASFLSCFIGVIFPDKTSKRVLCNSFAQISSNFLNIVNVLSKMSISTFFIANISHSSIPSDMYIIVNHVFLSQSFIDSWIGLAHLYIGKIEPCIFIHQCLGTSSISFGIIFQ